MSYIKQPKEIEHIRAAGQIVGSVLFDLKNATKPGITPIELDKLAAKLINERGGKVAFKGYHGYPAAICISVNDVVVHGIPDNTPLKEGDIVGFDIGAIVEGYYGDGALTVPVGKIDNDAQKLLDVTQKALSAGIERIQPGKHLGDVQAAIQSVIELNNMGIVRDLTGHGIGKKLHEDPIIPNYGRAGTGPILQPGMTICIEPMVTIGSEEVYQENDGWTIKTQDGSLAAQFEHTILVTTTGHEILTPVRQWPTPTEG